MLFVGGRFGREGTFLFLADYMDVTAPAISARRGSTTCKQMSAPCFTHSGQQRQDQLMTCSVQGHPGLERKHSEIRVALAA